MSAAGLARMAGWLLEIDFRTDANVFAFTVIDLSAFYRPTRIEDEAPRRKIDLTCKRG